MEDAIRIDSFLWAVRICKSRSIAGNACKMNRVKINGADAKPSRTVKVGDVISIKKPPITFSYRVLKLAKQRMGAKLVPEHIENITPESEYEILELQKIAGFVDRAKGSGRPTKKERRMLDEFNELAGVQDFFFADENFFDFDDDDDEDDWD